MIKFNGLVPCRREWSVVAASSLSGLALALTVGFVSMSVLLQSDDALAVDDCGSFVRDIGGTVSPGKMSADQRTGNIWMSSGGGVLGNRGCGFPTGTFSDAYTSGSERDRATTGPTDYNGFPLTAKADGTDPDTPSKGNIVYNLRDFVVFQTYTPQGATAAVRRPWWQAACAADSGQMCWTTIAGTVTAPPSGATLYYRMVDADSSIDYTGDYSEGPPVSRDDVNTLIVRPSAPTDQIAVKVQNSAGNLEDATHTKNLFIKSSWDAEDSIEYNGIVTLNLGWRDGIVVRGIKERIYRPGGGGLAERVPRSRVNGVDEDGFERYAVTFDTSTDIGLHVKRVRLISEGNANKHSVFEGGADKVSTIENGQINTEGGSKDGGGIEFGGGQAKEMFLKIGEVRAGNHNSIVDTVRDTIIARSAGEDSNFHAVHFHHDMEGEQGGKGEILVIDTTITMLNGGSSPEEGRGMIVTTGADSSGITISVTNPLGTDTTDDEFKGIGVRVDTPVTVKTSGARSHGIVLNLGYGEGQEENTALYQRAAVLLEAKDRNTLLQVGLTEGTVEKSLADGGLAFANGYRPSVRIATNGAKSGGIVIRNEGDAGAGGQAVNLLGFTPRRWAGQWSDTQSFSSDLGDLENYHLIVDKPIVTTGAGSHGVVASIAESGITMVVDIEDLDDGDADNGVEQTIDAGGTGSMALSGAGSMGKFTVNVKGHVTGGIATGNGADTINVGDNPTGTVNDKSPTITGGIDAGGGDDTVNVVLGSVTGTINSGSGCDTVELSAGVSVGGVSLGLCEGANKKNVLNTAVNIAGNVAAGGTTELNLAERTVGSVTLTGSGTTTVNGGTIDGSITFSAAAGTATKVVVGTSTNMVTLNGNIVGGAGNDEVELSSGTMFAVDDSSTTDENEASMITLGDGADTLTYTAVRGATATANARRNLPAVNAGAGCDTITLNASGSTGTGTDSMAGGINLGACEGDGMDRLTSNVVIAGNVESSGNSQIRLNGGSVNGNLMLGAGNDDVQLGTGVSVSGTVSLGDGDNNWRGGGSISGALTSGSGDDTVVLNSGYMVTTVDLGAGTNRLTSSQTTVLTSITSASAGASGETVAQGTTIQLNAGGVSGGMTFGAGNDVAGWVDAVSVRGAIVLGGGNDVVSGGTMNGSIDGGDGNDRVTLNGGSVTMMTGVETLNKMGTGTLTVGSMSNPAASSSTLSGSTADAGDPVTVNVEQGRLVVSGHLNLGLTGTLTVKRGAFLSFDVSGIAAQYQEGGTVSHGRITAREVVLERALPQIELVAGSAAPVAADIAAAMVSRLINGKVVRQAGATEEIVPAIVSGGAAPKVVSPGAGTPSGPTAAADDDDNTAIYAVGALAVLWWVMRRDDMGSSLVDYESGTAERSFATISGSRTHSSGAMKTWANYYSDSASPVQGLAVGMEAPISSNSSFSFSAMPEAKGSLGLNTLNQKSSFQGGHYSVKGKWQSEDYFATAELSYADAESRTSFDNPTAGGKLSGKFDMTNSHLEVGAGAKVQLTDTLSVAPTVGVYGGSISQGESVLNGRSVVASMSKQELSYTGWNLGIRVQPDAWTTDGAEFQPNFSLNTFRTSSDSRSLDLRQSDKAGVLDFSSQLPVQGMPAVVNAFRAGMTMKSETGLKLDLDYVGMEIDGELQHGAIARIQTRF